MAKLITDVSGASEVFPGSIVSYSNEIKKTFLG
ncbi:MAG: CinA family protein, partial [Clostridia bacterium]|nr:CinA family protein [Clostridia bacterium]